MKTSPFRVHIVRRVLGPAAFVVAAVMIFGADDYLHRERNEADRSTLQEMNQLCRSTLAPYNRNSPVGALSKQTMDNIQLASRGYCAGTSRARGFDALSPYHVVGKPSRAGVCKVVKSTSGCLEYLHQRVATRQQLLPPDFETKINELFKKMNVDMEFNTRTPSSAR